MMYPDFESEVADEIGKLGSKYPSNLFLTACELGNLNAVQYFSELNRNLTGSLSIRNDSGLL